MINVDYGKLEHFILYNSDSVFRNRKELLKNVKTMDNNQHVNYAVKNILFGIDKHDDVYDVEILEDATKLSQEQVKTLYEKLITMLQEHEDSRLDRDDIKYIQYFEMYFLKNVADKYLKKRPEQDFYAYADEYITKFI